jgi:hypothetical protein
MALSQFEKTLPVDRRGPASGNGDVIAAYGSQTQFEQLETGLEDAIRHH